MDKLIKLNRFTTLPVLLDLLYRQKLVLLNPATWQDQNDAQIILAYQQKAQVKDLFTLCFSHRSETIHLWKAFADGPAGCCIEFSARKLTEIFDKTKGIRHSKVEYKSIRNAGENAFKLKQIPFIKRRPYAVEQEYRVIWEGKSNKGCFELDVPIETINRITFNQQMPEPVYQSVKKLLIKNFKPLKNKINRSTIYKNETWLNYFRN
jgi:hypothetical protein